MDVRWRVLWVLSAARVSMGFQLQAVGAASPVLAGEYGLSASEIGFLIGVFLMPGILLALPGGMIGKVFGDKRTVTAGLLLMTCGSALAALTDRYDLLVWARAIGGTGAIFLNVLLTKIIADHFAEREIVMAMAILLNAFPIGIGLSLAVIPPVAAMSGSANVFWLSALVSAISLLLFWFGYREPIPAAGAKTLGLANLSVAEILPVCIAGIAWAIYNGAYVAWSGFAVSFLIERQFSLEVAGMLAGAYTALLVLSVQIGGWLGQRYIAPNLLGPLALLALGCALPLIAIPGFELIGVILAGLVGGLPAAAVMSLPASYLRPENRAVGMGIFLTWLYAGMSILPALVGWLVRIGGSNALVPIAAGIANVCAAALVLALLIAARPAPAVPIAPKSR